MTTYPEPPNRSIVGWGVLANHVRIRIDGWVPEGSDANWYPADDSSPYQPTNWASLNAAMRHYGTPYLLTPTDLTSALASGQGLSADRPTTPSPP